jgi:hypothetical protein
MATKKKAATPKKTPKTGKAKFGAKADFVRAQPASMSAKEVVEAAKKAGLVMTENHVYNVRSAAKKAGSKKAANGTPKTAATTKPASTPKSGGLEAQLRSAIASIGLVRAREILTSVELAFQGS